MHVDKKLRPSFVLHWSGRRKVMVGIVCALAVAFGIGALRTNVKSSDKKPVEVKTSLADERTRAMPVFCGKAMASAGYRRIEVEEEEIVLSAGGRESVEISVTERWSKKIRFKADWRGRFEPDSFDREYRTNFGDRFVEGAGRSISLPTSFGDSVIQVRLLKKPIRLVKFKAELKE